MLNDNIRTLLSCISRSDWDRARQTALVICTDEISRGSAKNTSFCKTIKERIAHQPQLMELSPSDRQMFVNDDSLNIPENMFYLSEREKEVEQRIFTMQAASEKLVSACIRYRTAVLLSGPSGTGKTTFARHLAKSLDRSIYVVSLSSIVSSYLGKTSENISKIFSVVARDPKALLFLDELDAVAVNRNHENDGSSAASEMKRVTLSIMQNMDTLSPHTIVVAATNKIDAIDNALIRRFPIQHEVLPLSEDERVNMVRQFLNAVKENAVGSFKLNWSDSDLLQYAHEAEGRSNSKITDQLSQAIADMLVANSTQLAFPPTKAKEN